MPTKADVLQGIGFGTDAISTVGNFFVAKQQHKAEIEHQRHRNAVAGISANLQRNAVTLQEIDTRQGDRRQNRDIQLRQLQDSGQAEVAAAAAGVAGGSVQSVMRGLKRSSLNAQYSRIENRENVYQALGQQRTNIDISQIFQTDNSVFPAPSVSALLLGLGKDAHSTFKKP